MPILFLGWEMQATAYSAQSRIDPSDSFGISSRLCSQLSNFAFFAAFAQIIVREWPFYVRRYEMVK